MMAFHTIKLGLWCPSHSYTSTLSIIPRHSSEQVRHSFAQSRQCCISGNFPHSLAQTSHTSAQTLHNAVAFSDPIAISCAAAVQTRAHSRQRVIHKDIIFTLSDCSDSDAQF